MFGRSGHAEPPAGGVLRELPAAGARPDERRARRPRIQGAGRSLPCDRGQGAFDGDRRLLRTVNDAGVVAEEKERARPGFYSAAHLQLNHYYTRSEAELAAKIGRGPNLVAKSPEYARKVRRTVANIEADEVEDRAALDYLARIGWEPMRTELIVSTYESPRALTLCLTSVAAQTVLPDSICIADDGSGPETKAAIDAFAAAHPELQVRHVWHEDRGFEKAAILNRAIASSEAEFLIFIDGDVLIAPWFIARHLELARPGRFSTGSLIRLDAAATAGVTPEMVARGRGLRPRLAPDPPGDRPARDLAEDDAVPAAGDGLPRPGDAGAAGALRGQRVAVPGGRAEGQRLRRDDQVRRRRQGVRGAAGERRGEGPASALYRAVGASRPSARLQRPGADPAAQGADPRSAKEPGALDAERGEAGGGGAGRGVVGRTVSRACRWAGATADQSGRVRPKRA